MKKHLFLLLSFFNVLLVFAQYENTLIPYRLNDKWGYSDINGNIKIKPVFDRADLFNNDGYAIVKQLGKFGIIDKKGNFVCTPKFKWIENKDNYYSKYFEVEDFIGKKFLINSKGIKINFNDYILERDNREEEMDMASNEGDCSFLALNRKNINIKNIDLDKKYIFYTYFQLNNDTFILCRDELEKFGVLNNKFDEIVPFEFGRIDVCYGLFKVYLDDDYVESQGLFTLKGIQILEPKFRFKSKKGANVLLESDNKFGIFDLEKSRITIPVKYLDIKFLKKENDYNYLVCESEEYENKQILRNYKLLDSKYEIISDTIFMNPMIPWNNSNYFIAKTLAGFNLYNNLGQKIFTEFYDKIIETDIYWRHPFIYNKTNYFLTYTAFKGLNCGLLNTNNQILVPFNYKYISILKNTPFAFVTIPNGKTGYINYITGVEYFKD